MSMTKEEAIERFEKQLTAAQAVLDSGFGTNLGESDLLYRRRKEMAEIALSALRPITREQVEKDWCQLLGAGVGCKKRVLTSACLSKKPQQASWSSACPPCECLWKEAERDEK